MGAVSEAARLFDAYFPQPGWWAIEGLWRDPGLDGIRDEPQFRGLLEKYGQN
jgi:hypothetical protein